MKLFYILIFFFIFVNRTLLILLLIFFNNSVNNEISELTKEIDKKIEEIKSNPSYDEEEGKKQIEAIRSYMSEHPKSPDEIRKFIDEKVQELNNK